MLARDGETIAVTITIDADEPLDLNERRAWPPDRSHRSVLYVRRVIVNRRYAGLGPGAALLDGATERQPAGLPRMCR